MDLSNDLISQFVKITNDVKKKNSESTVYGTVVEYNGGMYVKIDGSDLLTPVETTADFKTDERVTVMIKNHSATVTGNISSPATNKGAVTEAVEDVEGKIITEVDILIADRVSTKELDAEVARIDTLIAGKATIEELEAVDAKIVNLEAVNLKAVNAEIENLKANKAEITDLVATNATIGTLDADVARIKTLVNGNLTSDNILSLHITAGKVTMDDAFINDAMIANVSAGKIMAGSINTNLVSVQSEDGGLTITGSTQQFKDKDGNVRIQIGKDETGNFTFVLYDKNGTGVLIDENGIKSSAIADGLIRNDHIADNANISSGKLDISSLIDGINSNGEKYIKSNKIYLDENNQSLQVAFNQLKNKVEVFENMNIDGDLSSALEQITSNTTELNIQQGKIDSLISNTTIIKENGQIVQLKDVLNSTINTVDSHTQTISSLQSNVNKNTGEISTVKSNISTFEQNLNGFKMEVSDTYVTKGDMSNLTSRVSSAEQKITSDAIVSTVTSSSSWKSQTSNISAAQSTANDATTKANNAQNTANTANTQANTNKNNIATLQTTVTGTSNKVAELTTSLDGITQRVSSTESTLTTTTNKIDNLSIGGRNLIKNSAMGTANSTMTYDKSTNTWTITAKPGSGGKWGAGLAIKGTDVKIPYGKTYIFSFEIKVPRNCSWNIDVNNYASTGSSWDGNDNDDTSSRATSSKSLVAGQWVKCWSRFSNTNSSNTDKVDIYDNSIFGVVMANETTDMTYYIRDIQGEIGNIATDWTPAPEYVQSQIDTAQNTANTAQNTANTANTQANTNKNNIATLETTVTTTNNKVSTIETNLSGITSRVSATETNLTTTTNKLNNLQVGNTNLLVGSSDVSKFTDYWVNNGCSILNSYYKGSRIYKVSNAWQDYGFKLPSISSELATGKKYTYSVYVKSSSSSYLPEVNVYGGGWSANLGKATTSWQRFTFKGSFSSLTGELRVEATTSSDNANNYLMVAGMQLEEGEVLTDYSPSPKDSEITVSNLTTRVSNAESKLTKDSLTTTIGNHYTTSSDVNGIVTSKGYATTSEVQQTANSLTATFKESGGYNLLYNGDFSDGTNNWTNNGGRLYSTGLSSPTGKGIGFSGELSKSKNIHQTINLDPYVISYTISCYMYTTTSGSNGSTNPFRCFYAEVCWSDDSITYHTAQNTVYDRWEKVHITVTRSNLTFKSIKVYGFCRDTTKSVYFTDFMVEKGSVANTWSPNPNEVFAGVTKIDKNGIQVSQSNISATTKMDANGFYINKGGTDVFKVDSGGLTMKGNITGSTITGSTFIGSGTGNRVKINNGDYEIQTGDTTKGFFGLRILDDDGREIPRLALGSSGLNKNNHNYFAITHYPANNNPLNSNQTYADMTYRTHWYTTSDTSGDISNIRMLDDGDIHLAPVRNLLIKSSFSNGSHNKNTDETTLAEFGTFNGDYARYMETACIRRDGTSKGLILANYNDSGYSAMVRVCVDGSNYRFFAPMDSASNISLGSPSYLWQRVCAANGTINTSDRNLKDNIEYIQETANTRAIKSQSYSIKDMYDFVKDYLFLTTYTMKSDEEQKLKYGFIAQDIIDTKIGENIVYQENSDEGTFLGYDTMNYTNVLAGALKMTIQKIEELEDKIKELESK